MSKNFPAHEPSPFLYGTDAGRGSSPAYSQPGWWQGEHAFKPILGPATRWWIHPNLEKWVQNENWKDPLKLFSIRLFPFQMRWLPCLSLPQESLQPSPSHPLKNGRSFFSFSILTRAPGARRRPLLRYRRPKMKVRRNQLCDHDHCLQPSCSLSFHI